MSCRNGYKTILENWLENFNKLNVERTLINIPHMAEKVNEYLNKNYKKNIKK